MNWDREEKSTYPPDCRDGTCGECFKCYREYVVWKLNGERD